MGAEGNMADDVSYDDIITKDIFDLMGAKNMSEEDKKNLYTKILETIQNRVVARMADKLTDADTEKWLEVKKTNDKKKMNQFWTSKGIDINKLFLQEALIYKVELAQISAPIRKAADEFNRSKNAGKGA